MNCTGANLVCQGLLSTESARVAGDDPPGASYASSGGRLWEPLLLPEATAGQAPRRFRDRGGGAGCEADCLVDVGAGDVNRGAVAAGAARVTGAAFAVAAAFTLLLVGVQIVALVLHGPPAPLRASSGASSGAQAVAAAGLPPATKEEVSSARSAGSPALWWKTQVMYQVYPRSFQDADGDGTGDLRGLRRRLPYLKELGVGFVWLSPVMRSPMRDFGYDISSFTTVDPLFGSMQDMHDLLEAASAAGIRILVDFVPNHSSNESAWFLESRSSKTNPKRNWYIWHPGKVLADGTRAPPNNWASNFGGGLGSSWTWDEVTQEYYYHAFGEFQPDLNYHNPEVVEAMQDVLRFWLKMGAAGFRIDAVPFLLEDPLLRDEPVNESCARELPIWNCMQHIHTQNSPANHDIIKGWRRVVDEFDERVMFGEIYAKPSEMVKYYGTPEEPEFNVPFNFEVLGINYGAPNDLSDAKLVRDTVRKSAEALPNWCHGNWVLGNHDNHRLMSRVRNNTILASTIYNFFNLLPGTPTIYNGDEVGMNDLFIPYDQCVDPMCLKNPTKFVIAGRDPERTPMQWSPGPQAGFSDGKHPWLPVNPNHVTVNVETESGNLSSPLSIMRRTLAFRGDNPDIALGRITHVVADESLSGHLAGRVVAAQFATEAAAPFAVTVGNWDSSQAIEVDLLTLVSPDVRSAPPPSWRVRFSTDPDQPVGASSAQRLRLSRGAVAVLAPGASA